MNVSDKVKSLIGAECNEEILNFCCEEALSYIKNYCNINEVPLDLNATLVRMAYCLYKYSVGDIEVKSITRGDFSVTYSDKKNEIFESFNNKLIPFRKLKW